MLEFRPLRADEIDVRVGTLNQKGCSLLLYKDARCDMAILDETVGAMNWQRRHTRDNANCVVSIYDAEKNEWISKEDTGTRSNTEPEKGLASDSFKRACTNWGIGRELYTGPFIWVGADKFKIETGANGKPKTSDKFTVKSINTENGVITELEILRANKYGNEECSVFKYSKDRRATPVPVKDSAKTPPVQNEPPVIYSTPDELDELRFLLKQYSQLSGEQVTLSQVLKDVERTADKLEKDMLDKLVSEYKEKIENMNKVSENHVNTLIATIDRYNELTGQYITVQQVAKKQGFDKLEDFDIQAFKRCMDSFNKLIKKGTQNAQQG